MKYSMLLGGLAVVASTSALAATTFPASKATYQVDGYTVAASAGCGTAGTPTHSTVFYPGAGKGGMSLIVPSSAGGIATTTVCVEKKGELIPAGGLNGATLNFTCYEDTSAAEATSGVAATVFFGAAQGASTNVVTVQANTSVTGICTETTASTWAVE